VVSAGDGAANEFTFALADMAGFMALTEWHGDEHAAERTNHGTPLRSAYARPLRKSDDTYRSLAGAGLSSFCLTQPIRIKSAARSTLRGGVVEGGDLGATGSGDRARTKVTDSPTRTLAVANPRPAGPGALPKRAMDVDRLREPAHERVECGPREGDRRIHVGENPAPLHPGRPGHRERPV